MGLFTDASTTAAFHNAIRAETTAGFVTRSATASVTVGGDRFVFYSDREDGRYEVYEADFPAASLLRITASGGRRPIWSPDGRLLAYDNEGTLLTVGDGGRWVIPLGTLTSQAQEADWSPNYSVLVFRGTAASSTEIFTVGADGSGLRQLTNNTTTDALPSWAPGGGEIVFMSEFSGNPEIYSMKSDGSTPVRLTNSAAPGGTGEDTAPSWLVGSEILFSSKRSGVVSTIYAMKSNGSSVRELTPTIPFSDNASCPSWTADGQNFLYHAGSGFGPPDLFMRDASGGNLTPLLVHAASDLCPRWAPRRQGFYLTAAGVIIPNAAPGTPLPRDEVVARVKGAMVGVETGVRKGAGFVIAPGNLVLTVNHLIAGSGTITVRTADGTSRTATVVGRDLVRDLALLTLGPSVSLASLGFDEVGRLRTGDLLVAGGAATTTEALFSALDADEARNVTWIRTNGTFAAGLDGGPLVGPRGEVMGVISLRHAATEAGGAGIAIAANTVLNYLDRLKAGEVIVR
jgi:Tol biopolymer transport system component